MHVGVGRLNGLQRARFDTLPADETLRRIPIGQNIPDSLSAFHRAGPISDADGIGITPMPPADMLQAASMLCAPGLGHSNT